MACAPVRMRLSLLFVCLAPFEPSWRWLTCRGRVVAQAVSGLSSEPSEQLEAHVELPPASWQGPEAPSGPGGGRLLVAGNHGQQTLVGAGVASGAILCFYRRTM
jgi:hypothetical protein